MTVLQFSWASNEEVERINELARVDNIQYSHLPISKTTPSGVSSLQAVFRNRKQVLSIIKHHQIDTVIPRSTMPALVILAVFKQAKALGCEIIFDADGLPIQERLDQGFLKKNSIYHRILAGVERKILHKSDKVITRTQRAIDWHLLKSPDLNSSKFFVVGNGRDSDKFYFDKKARTDIRKKLEMAEGELLIIHSGSLGPAYSIELLVDILIGLKSRGFFFRMLFLTRDSSYLDGKIPEVLKPQVMPCQASFKEIPGYLSAADLGISLRAPTSAVRGILPIKVGEYLMCGLPILISSGIGDLDVKLKELEACFFLNHMDYALDDALCSWLKRIMDLDRELIQEEGRALFSLEKTLDSYQSALT